MHCFKHIPYLSETHPAAAVFIHRFAIGTATGSSFSHPREGMARSDAMIVNMMRQPIPSRRGVAEGRGVSHHIALCHTMSHYKTTKL